MAQNKNQHYVPRAHLRPFSLHGAGDAINLCNVSRGLLIANAPVKGQCSEDHFYGKDLKLERAFQRIEGRYASIIRKLEGNASVPNTEEMQSLRNFAFLQALRTKAAVERYQSMDLGLRNAVFVDWFSKIEDEPQESIIFHSMRLFAQSLPYISDLKLCILVNSTDSNFITSDDPACFANRYCMQRLRSKTFGWGNSGFLIFLPLTPRHALMCYDGLVYTMQGRDGYLARVRASSDVNALNEFQALNCRKNLYFSSWKERDYVHERLVAVSDRRRDRHEIEVLIRVGGDGSGEYYRAATDEEKTGNGPFILHSQSIFPEPRLWFSCLKFRDPPRTFSNGSAVGHVRKLEWLTD
jgi:hypothetical protein